MRLKLLTIPLVAAGAGLIGPAALAQGVSFRGLGDLAGGSVASAAGAVSADGRVVVGSSSSALGIEGFRWTEASGIVGIGGIPGNPVASSGYGVSADGSAIVGVAASNVGTGIPEAFWWTEAGGMVGLGGFPGGCGGGISWGYGVSANGLVVVGYGCAPDRFEAFRWTPGGGMQGLGNLPGNPFYSEARGVSADGSVVVGSDNSDNATLAYRWTAGGGMVALGDLPGGEILSEAYGVSGDGLVVVGYSVGVNGGEAFRWTQAGGWQGLGFLPSSTISRANAASGDGRVVVGQSPGPSAGAFIWTEADGMRSVRAVLVADGVDMTGWTLSNATGVSADGTVIVGSGTNPAGQPEAWRAVIPTMSITAPVLAIGGESTRVRFRGPSGPEPLDIYLLPDTLGSARQLVFDGLLSTDTSFSWTVPDALYSRSARLILRVDTDTTIADTSDYFRIKPYHLTRLTADGARYLPFRPAHHGWQHANAVWFPPAWWIQFNYANGSDPFTSAGYDDSFEEPPTNGWPGVHADWPAYVRAFGTDAAYHLIAGPFSEYRSSFTAAWGAQHNGQGYNGSCYGLATTSLLAFSYRTAFGALYPGVGTVERLFPVVMSDSAREAAHEQYSHQFGLLARTAERTRLLDGPRVALTMLKEAFAADSTSATLGSLSIKNVRQCAPSFAASGGHAVTPYRLQRDASGPGRWRIYVYDSNWPADSTRFVLVDSTLNAWSYNGGFAAPTPVWAGVCGLFVRDPIANYLQPAIVDPVGPSDPVLTESRRGGTLYVAAAPGANVRVASAAGAIGYANGVAFNSIPGALTEVHDVGGPAPPSGYEVPPGAYTLTMSAFPDSRAAAYVFGADAIYAYGRADADTAHTDRLVYDPSDGIGGGLTAASTDIGATKSVTLRAILPGGAGLERTLDAGDLPLTGADSVEFAAVDNPAGPRLHVHNSGGAKSYTLRLHQADASGGARFRHVGVPLAAGATHLVRPEWATLGSSNIEVDVDLNGDGIPDEVLVLENQPVDAEPGTSGDRPTQLALHPPAPNPGVGQTSIRFDLPATAHVRLALHDVLGREVAVLVDETRSVGSHTLALDTGRFAPGTYLLRLKAAAQTRVQRLTIAR